jgi:hypothetical protein
MIRLDHTPGPWRVDADNRIVDMQDRVICPCVQAHDLRDPAFGIDSKQLAAKDDGGSANAHYICRAVNGFEKLLERLDNVELVLEGLLAVIEDSEFADRHKGKLLNARNILLNDPTLFTPELGGAA